MPAHRPLTASAANRPAWTSLSTPAGASGTSSAGAKSTASERRTTTANTPRDKAPWTCSAARIRPPGSEPVEVGFTVGADHGEARLPGEQLRRDLADLRLV